MRQLADEALGPERVRQLADEALGHDPGAAMRAMSQLYMGIRSGAISRADLDKFLSRLRWVDERRGHGST